MSDLITVNIKAGGAMVQYMPDTASANNAAIQCDAACSVKQLLLNLGIPDEQPLMIILNDAMVARPDYQSTLLADNDTLSLMPPIQAG